MVTISVNSRLWCRLLKNGRSHEFSTGKRRYASDTLSELVLDHSRANGIVTMGINRPANKNAMSRTLMASFTEAMASLQSDKSARVVVLHSMVPGIFCAGADLKERATMAECEVAPLVARARSLFQQLHRLPMATVCALDGPALGGGLEMALACDLRVASNEAKMGLVETRLAIIPGAGGTQRLPRILGAARAKELLFTARPLTGEEAAQIGLVNFAVPQNSKGNAAFLRSLQMAEQIAANGPIGVRMCKAAVDRGIETDLETGLSIEEACYAQVIPTKDRVEGLRAFKEKRKPNYVGE